LFGRGGFRGWVGLLGKGCLLWIVGFLGIVGLLGNAGLLGKVTAGKDSVDVLFLRRVGLLGGVIQIYDVGTGDVVSRLIAAVVELRPIEMSWFGASWKET